MTDDIEWGEWGEWSDLRDDILDGIDYQMQRIDLKNQYRVRKASPAPVLAVETSLGVIDTSGLNSRFAIWNGDCDGDDPRPQFALTFQTRDGEVDTPVAPTVKWVKP